MLSTSVIEQCKTRVGSIAQLVLSAENSERLPLSFFTEAIELIEGFKDDILALEKEQICLLQQHLQQSESQTPTDNAIEEALEELTHLENIDAQNELPLPAPTPQIKQSAATPVEPQRKAPLSEFIARKLFSDLNSSLTLNQRFAFRRDIFHGDDETMRNALSHISSFDTVAKAISWLDSEFSINWDSESGAAFREALDRYFN
jgi:hypothetical protein